MLDWAARLVVRGVNVIPLEGKVPRGPWKQWQDTRQIDLPDKDADHFLLLHFSLGGNLGAITGAVSQIVVVDADSRAAWDALAAVCGGSIPRTVVSITGKGRHVWLRHPGSKIGNRVRLDGLELDLRGDGGYVVCPPSRHPSGSEYRWHRSPLDVWPPAPLPGPLLDLLRPPAATATLAEPLHRHGGRYAEAALEREAEAVRSAVPGTRNDGLNRAAFAVARFVLTGELRGADVAEVLTAAAVAAGLAEHEARATIASALRARRAS